MIYTNEFQDMTVQATSFIGCGNPNANILIIGKEAAIAPDNKQQQSWELDSNIENWKENINQCKSLEDIKNYPPYNRLYPYKGQIYKVGGDKGTSRTWYQYQKLLNHILKTPDNKTIKFHENCFTTDFSANIAKYSHLTDKSKTQASIDLRKVMFAHPFFQHFPIVLVACGHYPKTYGIDLEKLFQVTWKQPTQPVGRFWLNIHRGNNPENPKLLIHTNQLSMASNELIYKIAEYITSFTTEYNIKL